MKSSVEKASNWEAKGSPKVTYNHKRDYYFLWVPLDARAGPRDHFVMYCGSEDCEWIWDAIVCISEVYVLP